MRTLLLALLGGALLAPAARAQDGLPPIIDRELFFGDPEITGAQISPDGEHISFIRPYNGARNVYVKRREEPFDTARPITADQRPVAGYFWSQDGRYVLYVQDKGGNEDFHVYAVDPRMAAEAATGVPPARDLTPAEGVRAVIYDVPESEPDVMYVGLNDRDRAWHDLYRVSIATGERTLVLQNDERLTGFVFDLDGNLRLATRTAADGSTEILRVEGGTLSAPVYTCSVLETCYPIRFHQDGQRVYMATNRGNVNLQRLVLFDPATGTETAVEADPENEVDFGGAVFSYATDELVATYYVGDRLRYYPKTEQARRDWELLRSKLSEGEIYLVSSTKDDRYYLVRVTRDVDPGSVYLYDRQTGEVTLLYRSRPNLPTEHLAEMQPVRYPARDGRMIPAYLTVPKGVEPRDLPAIILPHGGPWSRDTWGYSPFVQFLANRGYAVLQPNFRGSTGYGKDFLNAGNKEWGTGAMQHDLSDGVRYLIEQEIADPERIGIFGGSYGGYATLAGLAFTPELYAAGVSFVGPSNLITLLGTIPPYWEAIRNVFHTRMGNPDEPEDRARLEAQSPLHAADQIRAPLMVIQGANDPRVKQSESDQIVVALRDRGFPVEYLVAPDEGHGFRAPDNNLAVAAAMERFFARHLGGRYQEEMPENVANTLERLTVDVSTVERPVFVQPEAVAAAAAAQLPETDGTKIQPATLRFKTTINTMGQTLELNATRVISQEMLGGQPIWRVIDTATLPPSMGGGTAVDTFDVHRATLRPLRRSSVAAMGTVLLNYTDDLISGEIGGMGQRVDISASLDAPVFGDGGALELALAGMPLQEGFETTIRSYNLQQQKVRPMRLRVTGQESISGTVGTFDTYVVALEPLDGDDAGAATFWVTRERPHYVVRAESRLPAMMGGGTLRVDLTGRE